MITTLPPTMEDGNGPPVQVVMVLFQNFHPELQIQRFDPEYIYIKRWIPEFGTDQYPAQIIDHAFARDRAIARYKEGLGEVATKNLKIPPFRWKCLSIG